jgi:hypothetical protein
MGLLAVRILAPPLDADPVRRRGPPWVKLNRVVEAARPFTSVRVSNVF